MLKTKLTQGNVLELPALSCVPELRPVFIVLIHTELNSQVVILIVN